MIIAGGTSMRRIVLTIIILMVFLQSGCAYSGLFDSKKVKLLGSYIEFPVIVENFLPDKQSVVMNAFDQNLDPREIVILDYDGFKAIVYNDTSNESIVKNSKVIGIAQTIEDVNNGAETIIFPEGIRVGMEITTMNLSMKLIKSGGIYGDSSITSDGNIDYVTGGKRWVDLSGDWVSQTNTFIHPVEITLKDNVVISVQMIFMDK